MTTPARPTQVQVGYALQNLAHLAEVDAAAYALLERWAYALAVIAAAVGRAEHGAAYGTGQAELRTYQRGGDPVLQRLADGVWPTHISDPERARLKKLHAGAVGRFGYDLAWLERELEPWVRELEKEQAG